MTTWLRSWLVIIVAALAWGAGMVLAHENDPVAIDSDSADALEISQAAIGRAVADHRFRDAAGMPISLAKFRGRPHVVSLVYTSCAHTCPLLTQRLAHVVDIAREALGEDSFSVITVGFDSRADTPDAMRSYARRQGIDSPEWAFVSGDAATIAGLSRDLGFTFSRSAKGFDHIAQTSILDADGRVYRQVYGAGFEAPALVEPLKELVFGARTELTSLTGWANRVRLFCTIYSPASGRYRTDYSLFVGIVIGLASLAGVGIVLVRGWLRQPSADKTL